MDDKKQDKKSEGAHEYNIGGMAGKKINPDEQPTPRTGGTDKSGANESDD